MELVPTYVLLLLSLMHCVFLCRLISDPLQGPGIGLGFPLRLPLSWVLSRHVAYFNILRGRPCGFQAAMTSVVSLT
ncbi:hypothetical protein CC80DRAFT_199666 [Byssothecium circinans]|uniref:Secreted protein n=1 Tax=Byssothecium circinans TaxID=147558 RepID=A0A6A5UAX3_9PLEO|nr:hypothetical protein CC80DRAFT_199666 [Byssothecium circinans]